jgi:hypothetical protein
MGDSRMGKSRAGKSRKHTKRGDHYQTMAAGYQILRSPLADSYNAAAEHYRKSDPPIDPATELLAGSDADRDLDRENGPD